MIQHGSWQCHYPLDSVMKFVEDHERQMGLDLNPDFQRGHVWTAKQQKAWLEFFLRCGKTGRVLYFNCPSWHTSPKTKYNDFVIVDGKQRLEAIRRFYANEIKVFGSYASEFTDKPCMVAHCIEINVNDLPRKADVLNWYLQMNEGGVKHTEMELTRVRVLMMNELAGKTPRPPKS